MPNTATSREFATYANVRGLSAQSPRVELENVVNEFATDYDLDAAEAQYRAAIDAAIDSLGVTLCGEQFYSQDTVPFLVLGFGEDLVELINEEIDGIDTNAILQACER